MGENTKVFGDMVRSVATPLDAIPDRAWDELTDPANFLVGSALTLCYGTRSKPIGRGSQTIAGSFWDGFRRGTRIGARVSAMLNVAIVMVAATLLPILVGTFFPRVGTGDPTVYALTLLVAGAFTLIPGRVSELREKGRLRGHGYPRRLRKVMWNLESFIVITTIVMLSVWNVVRLGDDESVRAVVWGVLAVAVSDLLALSYIKLVAVVEMSGEVEQAVTTN
jgi:hypothetical protein